MAGLLMLATEAKAAPLRGERFPQTRTRALKVAEVRRLSKANLQYAINEVYARHGYVFKNINTRRRFLEFSWYKPVVGLSAERASTRFTATERRNTELMIAALRGRLRAPARRPTETEIILDEEPRAASVRPTGRRRGEQYPGTRTHVLTDREIARLTNAQVRYALNEIYARHGYAFGQQSTLRRQFSRYSWYRPRTGVPQGRIEQTFNRFETENARHLADEIAARR